MARCPRCHGQGWVFDPRRGGLDASFMSAREIREDDARKKPCPECQPQPPEPQ